MALIPVIVPSTLERDSNECMTTILLSSSYVVHKFPGAGGIN